MTQLSGPLTMNLKRGDMICAEGELDYDLFIVHSGKVLIFVTKGTQVTPLAHIGPGEYLGELSFFDKKSRSANAVCLEDTTVIKVPIEEASKQFPDWLETLAMSITSRLRRADELLAQKGIRKKNVQTMASLSIDEQREYFKYLQEYREENGLIQEQE
jgi:CRP-like cAMP-binding protein